MIDEMNVNVSILCESSAWYKAWHVWVCDWLWNYEILTEPWEERVNVREMRLMRMYEKEIKMKYVYGIVRDMMTVMPCVCVNGMLVHGYECTHVWYVLQWM